MRLEQTIQRSKKSLRGIVGQTKQENYIIEWELVCHEALPISNYKTTEIFGSRDLFVSVSN